MNVDLYIFQGINNLAGRFVYLDSLAVFFAEYFGYILIGLALVFLWKKWGAIFWAFAAAILARYGLVELIRFFWLRPRPFIENEVNLLLEHADTGSFPSGHAAFFFALSTVIFLYYKKVYPRPKFWWGVGALFFIASFSIAISRVFVGIHWPSDILAGAIVGIFSGWLILKIFRK